MKTPENFFEPGTARFVALRTFDFGTTAYGYGETLAAAVENSRAFDGLAATVSVRAYEKTEETKKRGRYLWQVYRPVA